ncbi:hypothetical protein [Xenorhabdus bovienii]|uniref:Transposase n=1 Tax=Xenorhabdus bovienii TaxID=40576 RepID=A0A0B6XG70_XENBV
MIVQALCIHETTVTRHHNDYLNNGKLASENGGSEGYLSVEQTKELVEYLTVHTFHHIQTRWNITFTIPK